MSKKATLEASTCPRPIGGHATIQLSHGSGGKMTSDLISEIFIKAFSNDALDKQNDQAIINIDGSRLAFTTDSFVVDPIFFPGGDIGDLAVNGTVNDICTCGAKPLYLSVGFIIEEGFSIKELDVIVQSMKRASEIAGVKIVTGDTKVVNKGKGDKIFINSSGIGIIEHDYNISSDNLRVGNKIIINGTIADHGVAILSKREGLAFETEIESDSASLNGLVDSIMKDYGPAINAMRDPTRGGVAATLNEFASSSKVGITLFEETLPLAEPVRSACELLGLDPLLVANEGKIIFAVEADQADSILALMKKDLLGKKASIIGEVVSENPGMVTMRTIMGSRRIVDMPVGEQLPRIC